MEVAPNVPNLKKINELKKSISKTFDIYYTLIITYLGQNRPRKVPTGVTILRKVDAISAHF